MSQTQIDYDKEKYNLYKKYAKKYDLVEDWRERHHLLQHHSSGECLLSISEKVEKLSSFYSDSRFWLEAKYDRQLENYKKKQKRLVFYYVVFFVAYFILLTCLAKVLNYEGHTLYQITISIGSRIFLSMVLGGIHVFITYRFFKNLWETGSLTRLWILIACIGGVAVISFISLATVDCIIFDGTNIVKFIMGYICAILLIALWGTVGFFVHWGLYEYIFRKQKEEDVHLKNIEQWIQKADKGRKETQKELQEVIAQRIESIKNELD